MYTLVIFAFIQSTSISLGHIENFKTKASCEKAASEIKQATLNYTNTVCITK